MIKLDFHDPLVLLFTGQSNKLISSYTYIPDKYFSTIIRESIDGPQISVTYLGVSTYICSKYIAGKWLKNSKLLST